jgi:hypothetical protein
MKIDRSQLRLQTLLANTTFGPSRSKFSISTPRIQKRDNYLYASTSENYTPWYRHLAQSVVSPTSFVMLINWGHLKQMKPGFYPKKPKQRYDLKLPLTGRVHAHLSETEVRMIATFLGDSAFQSLLHLSRTTNPTTIFSRHILRLKSIV